MVKVEVIVNAADRSFVETLFRAEDVVGWTALPGLSGFGHGGRHEGRLLFNEQMGQTMLITVVPEAKLEGIVAGLRALLETHAGVLFVSDAYVSRPMYFVNDADGRD